MIESVGVIPPLIIFYRGITELINRITNFEINLKTENTNIITISPSKNILNGFEIIVINETDTLGNIIQENCFEMFAMMKMTVKILLILSVIKEYTH